MANTLVLFDIDGTLLVTGGASSRCIRRASETVLGERFRWGKPTVGTLDPQIFIELAGQCGIEDAAAAEPRYRAVYLAELEAELQRCAADVRVLPGVRELIGALRKQEGVTCGLLTGNYGRAVELKLAAAGLDPTWFAVGAFAEHGSCRNDLVPAAMAQYRQRLGRAIEPRDVVVIGDTPRDIACARHSGCRVIAVATGYYSVEQLRAEGADCVVADLNDPAALEAIVGGGGAEGMSGPETLSSE